MTLKVWAVLDRGHMSYNENVFLCQLSHSGDLLLWVGVRDCVSSVVH